MIAEIRQAMADALDELDGFEVYAYQMANPSPPCVQIIVGPAEYDLAHARGVDRLEFRVQGMAGLTTDIGAQQVLDELFESNAIKDLLEVDQSLDGNAASVFVRRHGGQIVWVPEGKGPMLGAEWAVEVLVQPNGG